jgi:hypothetical protein
MFCYEEVFKTYQRLADPVSRELYVDVLRYRLSGHLHVRVNPRIEKLANEKRRFKQHFVGLPSALPITGMFGSLMHYDAKWDGVGYIVGTVGDSLVYYLVYRQYCFERDGVVIRPEPGDHLIDGGSFTGDSGVVFSRAVGPRGRVYSFDPIEEHLRVARSNFSRPGLRERHGVRLRNFGPDCSRTDGEARPVQPPLPSNTFIMYGLAA